MAFLTKKEFAERCGMNTKKLATYKINGKVVYTDDGRVNDQVEPNRSFLADQRAKSLIKGKTPTVDYGGLRNTRPPTPDEMDSDGISFDDLEKESLIRLNHEKLKEQVEKLKNENRKLKLGNEKVVGAFLPVDQTVQVIIQLSEAIYQACENEMEERDRVLVGELGLDREWGVKLRRGRIEAVNTAKEKAIKAAKVQIRRLQDQISDQRGRGEHD